jgi:HEPN domain-containing protein
MKVMDSLFKQKHYPYSLYFGHLVLEKVLKGYYVKTINKSTPYTHNLIHIAEKCRLKLNANQRELLESTTRFNIETRYPDAKFQFHKMCTREFTEKYIRKIREFYKWLIRKI